MATVTLPPPVNRYTRTEYHRLAELGCFQGKRIELIRGEIVELSPVSWAHTLAKTMVADALRLAFVGVGWVNEQGLLPTDDSEPEPDVAVYAGKARDYTDHPTLALLVVEVAESSLKYDTSTKVGLYAEAGHAEYWVLDLKHRTMLIDRNPIPLPNGEHGYLSRSTAGEAESVTPLGAPHVTITALSFTSASRVPSSRLFPTHRDRLACQTTTPHPDSQ